MLVRAYLAARLMVVCIFEGSAALWVSSIWTQYGVFGGYGTLSATVLLRCIVLLSLGLKTHGIRHNSLQIKY